MWRHPLHRALWGHGTWGSQVLLSNVGWKLGMGGCAGTSEDLGGIWGPPSPVTVSWGAFGDPIALSLSPEGVWGPPALREGHGSHAELGGGSVLFPIILPKPGGAQPRYYSELVFSGSFARGERCKRQIRAQITRPSDTKAFYPRTSCCRSTVAGAAPVCNWVGRLFPSLGSTPATPRGDTGLPRPFRS